jgi:succinate dehydrogenase/fumarate reductase flavoprotein subunit
VGETLIGGLYAAGVAAYYGPGPSPQSLCIVGGYRAGENAAKWAKEAEFAKNISDQTVKLKEAAFLPLQRKKGVSPDQIYYSVNKLVTPWEASLFKHERRIKDVLSKIRQIAKDDLPRIRADDVHELVKAAEARNFVLLMELYNIAALERKESRTVHFREEYPYTDDREWRKLIVLRSDGKGGVKVDIEPVSLGCSAIMPESLTKKPVPVSYKMEGR